ncbi:uncharacterized protein BJ212DRAFT_1333002 [Suillus subaureus]|uniref:Uncharacterized protein n=1 Tax=Suillus subaureus TaxID=48587 RepID=A0A9P7EH89_9AGAM|nr:uncharacterized protein BJ212DRAFT_1333002 [Suillus subaureus]KAG1821715.1 hypothetical protein BJ212DRAFT_1333002 [Suillus subaureus]
MMSNAGQIIVKPVVDCKPAPSLMHFHGDRHTPIATLADFDCIFNSNARGTFLCLCIAAKVIIKRGTWWEDNQRVVGIREERDTVDQHLLYLVCSQEILLPHFIFCSCVSPSEFGSHGITVNTYVPGPVDTRLL